jgi:hypothetical protein
MSVSTLLYDLVDQHTFECLLAQFEGVLTTPQDERGKKRLKHRSRRFPLFLLPLPNPSHPSLSSFVLCADAYVWAFSV